MKCRCELVMRKWIILLILAIGIVSSTFLIVGFVQGINSVLKPTATTNLTELQPKAQPDTRSSKNMSIVALGDSLTRGVGDDTGEGYVGNLKKMLKDDYNQKTTISNLAISGAESAELAAQIQTKGIQYNISQADLITITMGGNDLFPGVNGLDKLDTYVPDTDSFVMHSQTILKTIRSINSDAPIYWVSLYNPFEDLSSSELNTSTFVIEWNAKLATVATEFPNVYIVPVFDLFQGRNSDFLSSDHFHPNEKGHATIAKRLMDTIASHKQLEVK